MGSLLLHKNRFAVVLQIQMAPAHTKKSNVPKAKETCTITLWWRIGGSNP